MASYDYDIGIIGCGAAGLTAAAGAAQLGAKTLMVEKEKVLGGDCLHYGCVPSKTLLKSAKVYHLIRNSTEYGLPKVEAPPVDFRFIRERIKRVIDIIQEHDSEERFCDLGAKVEFGSPSFLDEHSIDLGGKKFSARSWVIATGSSPMTPPIEGLSQVDYLTNKDIFYMDSLPKSMIIMGGGPIGIEMAQAFRRLGTKIQVIERGPQILGKEDPDMAEAVMQVLESEGIKFHLNAGVVGVRQSNGVKQVFFEIKENGQTKKKSLKAESLLVALGRSANLEGLNLDGINVKHDGRGIHVDKRLRSSQKNIYAAGDAGGGFQFTHVAGYEAGVVVTNAIARLPRRVNYKFLPWCTYTDPELANIGLNETWAKKEGIKYSVWEEEFIANDRSLAEENRIGKIKMILNEREKPIGVQIFGPSAGDLLSEWVGVLNGGVRLSTLAGAIHPYPTLGEINRNVAIRFMSEKIYSEKIKKGLKFLFKLKGRACDPDEK